jgi:hypothetical protein
VTTGEKYFRTSPLFSRCCRFVPRCKLVDDFSSLKALNDTTSAVLSSRSTVARSTSGILSFFSNVRRRRGRLGRKTVTRLSSDDVDVEEITCQGQCPHPRALLARHPSLGRARVHLSRRPPRRDTWSEGLPVFRTMCLNKASNASCPPL